MARVTAVAVVVVACLLATAGEAAAQGCTDAQLRPDGSNRAEVVVSLLCFANAERQARGLARLAPHAGLRRAATTHSANMVAQGFFGHVSPSGSTLLERVRKVGYTRGTRSFRVKENLGWGIGRDGSAQTIVTAWMGSSVHRPNLLMRRFRHAGIGVATGTPTGSPGATVTMVMGFRR